MHRLYINQKLDFTSMNASHSLLSRFIPRVISSVVLSYILVIVILAITPNAPELTNDQIGLFATVWIIACLALPFDYYHRRFIERKSNDFTYIRWRGTRLISMALGGASAVLTHALFF